jgi:hypothetical protein
MTGIASNVSTKSVSIYHHTMNQDLIKTCPIALYFNGVKILFIGTNKGALTFSKAIEDILSNTEYYDNDPAYSKLLFGVKIADRAYDYIYSWDTVAVNYTLINYQDAVVIYAFPSRALLCYKASQIYCYFVDNNGDITTVDIDEGEILYQAGYSFYIKQRTVYNVVLSEVGQIIKKVIKIGAKTCRVPVCHDQDKNKYVIINDQLYYNYKLQPTITPVPNDLCIADDGVGFSLTGVYGPHDVELEVDLLNMYNIQHIDDRIDSLEATIADLNSTL